MPFFSLRTFFSIKFAGSRRQSVPSNWREIVCDRLQSVLSYQADSASHSKPICCGRSHGGFLSDTLSGPLDQTRFGSISTGPNHPSMLFSIRRSSGRPEASPYINLCYTIYGVASQQQPWVRNPVKEAKIFFPLLEWVRLQWGLEIESVV